MLRELKIENLAIIDKLDLEFDDGFIVLTGETGAGKSIILSGINLLIGEKASTDMIRTGEDTLLAQGVFEIPPDSQKEIAELFGIEVEDGEVIIRRTLSTNGKGKAYVNGVRVSLTNLKQIMKELVDIVGQHSHQMLLSKSNHIKLLDKFLGEEGEKQKEIIRKIYDEYREIVKNIENIEKNRVDMIEKKEFYTYQLGELEKANLKPEEDEKLEEEYKKLFNAGKIKDRLEEAIFSLSDGDTNARDLIYNAKRNIESLVDYGDEFGEIVERLDKVYYEIDDCIDVINTLGEDVDIDDNKLTRVVGRIDKLNKLKNKYGTSIEEIIKYKDTIKEKLDLLDENNVDLQKLVNTKNSLEEKYWQEAHILRNLRRERANEIERSLKEELKFLMMEESQIHIVMEDTHNITPNGSDSVEIFISTNRGQGLKPLAKIASGGEVSRIMLALKVIFSRVDNIPILIFDEIDTGVGGETVRKIADKLRQIGEQAQVLSITHSPAIAARAHEQFFIEKNVVDDNTMTTVTHLNEQERIDEIGRMLAGENITEAVRKHAKELLGEN